MAGQGALSRGIAVLESLVGFRDGRSLADVAVAVELPKSATHRLLANLIEDGYVRQHDSGRYLLTLAPVSLGLRHLAATTITDLALPLLEALARESGQLVRLALADRDRLVWVARQQGARSGLRYDPDVDHGEEIPLDASATGFAWLSCMPVDDAIRLVMRQDAPRRHTRGPNAPSSVSAISSELAQTRSRGWAEVHDANELGISAMAMPIVDPDHGTPLGAVSIAGPTVQFPTQAMRQLAPALRRTVQELAGIATTMASERRRAS